MRTHIFGKMTAGEIADYLKIGKDAIFVAVGVTEIHGEMPVEAETILAEGVAVALAEKCDAIALTNLPYFYPGGTVIGSGTVHTSMREGYAYLWKILKSLVDQGFKKLFIVPGHGGISMFVLPLIRDFFEATHIHPVLIETMNVVNGVEVIDSSIAGTGGKDMAKARQAMAMKSLPPDLRTFETVICGAYKIRGMERDIPVNPNAVSDFGETKPNDPALADFAKRARAMGGVAALIFSDPLQHGGGLVFKSEQERDEKCAEGERIIRDAVDKLDLEHLLKVVGDYQAYTLEVCEKFPHFNNLAVKP